MTGTDHPTHIPDCRQCRWFQKPTATNGYYRPGCEFPPFGKGASKDEYVPAKAMRANEERCGLYARHFEQRQPSLAWRLLWGTWQALNGSK